MRIKHLVYLLPLALLAALACVGTQVAPRSEAPKGAWTLDSEDSVITATALKNGKKKVPVNFSGMHGWADAGMGAAELSIPLIYLSTGDGVRDFNVKNQFFEVGKLSSYATATFKVGKIDADVSNLAQGAALSITAQAHGSLTLHGSQLDLSGPVLLVGDGKTITATLLEGWMIHIDQTSMTGPLARMNRLCPQPHVVANDVPLTGTLIFVP